jgi:predicted nucleotidyltransferase
MNREDVVARLRRAKAELERAGVGGLYLFGSTARDEAGPTSDVDLFFDVARETFGIFDLMDVRDLVSTILSTKIDMIPRDGLHPSLRGGIEAAALRIF